MTIRTAIVGRPNVGKSTLFNRLAGRRAAIVDDTPGVTRDRQEILGRLGDMDLALVDTAGFEDVRDESLEARMRAQTEMAIADAEVVLFVVDARAGITPLDELFADLLRRADKPVIVVANKAEGRAGKDGVLEAFALGLGEPVAVSAEHGEGMSDLYAAIQGAVPDVGGMPDDAAPRSEALTQQDEALEPPHDGARPLQLAIVGRPNAGKSTLINSLLGEERLLTGPEAGITRDSIGVNWNWADTPVRLIDTAGMRRKSKVVEKLEKLSVSDTISAIRFAEVVALVMDAREAFEKQDLQIADLVAREGRAIVYVLAKWDLVDNPQARFAALRETADRLLPQTRGAPLIALSAHTGLGLNRVMPAVMQVYQDWNARVKTGDLNRWLHEAMTRNPPPVVDGRRIKPRYITQIKARPPTFVLMCSRADDLPDTYRRFLLNGIRKAFALPAVPMRLFVRQSRNPYATGED